MQQCDKSANRLLKKICSSTFSLLKYKFVVNMNDDTSVNLILFSLPYSFHFDFLFFFNFTLVISIRFFPFIYLHRIYLCRDF